MPADTRPDNRTMIWTLVGLGNPGPQYEHTRHNVGFELIDMLSARWRLPIDHKGASMLFGSGDFCDQPVLLVKPMTYMNRSGEVIRRLLLDPAVSLERMLIIFDDLHLPLGRIRLRPKGSHGGHNGLRSIIASVQTTEIPRLRIGIDAPEDPEDWADYVLNPFTSREREIMNDTLITGIDVVETLFRDGFETAMGRFNAAAG